jgi:hypothetical protein
MLLFADKILAGVLKIMIGYQLVANDRFLQN